MVDNQCVTSVYNKIFSLTMESDVVGYGKSIGISQGL